LCTVAAVSAAAPPPTRDEARAFVENAEARLLGLSNRQPRAGGVYQKFLPGDTEEALAEAPDRQNAAPQGRAARGGAGARAPLPPDVARRLQLLKLSLDLPAPSDPRLRNELTEIAAWLPGTYGKGKYCPPGKECQSLSDLEKVMATSRSPDELLEAWRGWHDVAKPMRPRYERFVTLANQGARELGFADMGALWRSNYDQPPEAFAAEIQRLWQQVKPLYDSLHTYVRRRLVRVYGAKLVPETGPLPAHLLGNMWGQTWSNIYPLVAP